MDMDRKRVVIAGGGVAGLSAAYTLKKHPGLDPLLLEADDQVGGRMGGERIDGFSTDKGADFFTNSYDVTFELCDELDLPLIRDLMTTGWYRKGRWVVTTPVVSPKSLLKNIVPLGLLGFISPRGILPTMRLVRSLRRDAKYLNYGKDHRIAELDTDETYGEYLDRLRIPDDLRVTLAGFLELTMGRVEEFGATWIRALISEGLLKAPLLLVPRGGCSALSEALHDRCADDIRLSTPVERVIIEDGRATGVVCGGGERIDADAVICATPAHVALDIIPDISPEVRDALKTVTYSKGIRVVVGLDRRPLPAGWHVVLYPEDGTPALLDRTINLPECAPPGKSTLDLMVGENRADELFPLDDEEITRRLLADARRNAPPGSAIPDYEDVLFSRVYRWNEVVCKGKPGMFTAILELRERISQDVPNLFFAGDFMRSPIVNGAVTSGVDAANEVAGLLARER